jgi:hypothetical protein
MLSLRVLSIALSLYTVVLLAGRSSAYITVPREPIPNKAALADCIVVGKITSIRPKPVEARLYHHGEGRIPFVVAEVQVTEMLHGAKDAKQVSIGFIEFQVKAAATKPKVGQEGVFFGVKNSEKDFFVIPDGGFHEKKQDSYAKDLEVTRLCARALNEPKRSLASRDKTERLAAAYVWSLRISYTPMRWGGELKSEPVEAELSKAILLALADADWDRDPKTGVLPASALSWLQIGAHKAGHPFPDKVNWSDPAAAKPWLRDNAATYRLHRLTSTRTPRK